MNIEESKKIVEDNEKEFNKLVKKLNWLLYESGDLEDVRYY